MHDRQGRQHVFECDACDATFTSDQEEFVDAWNEAKADGWRAEKLSARDWLHRCDRCAVR